jgi:hypothetical protein
MTVSSAPDEPRSSTATVVVEADDGQLQTALRHNTTLLLAWSGLTALVIASVFVAVVTDIGRGWTYVLLVALLVVIVSNLSLGFFLRRRIRGFQRVRKPFLVIDDAGFRFAGVDPIGWEDVLGVIYGDTRGELHRGGVFARWAKQYFYRAGGSQIMLAVGIDRPKRFQRTARGVLRRYFDAAFDLGGLIIPLDTALNDDALVRVRSAVGVAAERGNVPYLESTDPREIGRAALSLGTGRRMRRRQSHRRRR